jgi:hypothetical protein
MDFMTDWDEVAHLSAGRARKKRKAELCISAILFSQDAACS